MRTWPDRTCSRCHNWCWAVPCLSQSEKPEFICQSTLLSWKYSFLGQLREFSLLLATVSQSALVSVYSFTVILGVILKKVFLFSHYWMDGFISACFMFIISSCKARKAMCFQQRCNVTWYWFYAARILSLKWPFLNAYFQQRKYCL